jgi:hypothetical protein
VDGGRKAGKGKYMCEKKCSKEKKLREVQSCSYQGSFVSCRFQVQHRTPSFLKINPNGKSTRTYFTQYQLR